MMRKETIQHVLHTFVDSIFAEGMKIGRALGMVQCVADTWVLDYSCYQAYIGEDESGIIKSQ